MLSGPGSGLEVAGLRGSSVTKSKHIVQSLTKVINQSFKPGEFPFQLGGQGIDLILSKIFEKAFLKIMLSLMVRHNPFSCDQFGFRIGKSSIDAVVILVNMVVRETATH